MAGAPAADAAGQPAAAPPQQPPEVSDLEALFMKVRDQPCSVLEVRRADERGGRDQKPLRTKQAILDRELNRVYEAKTLQEIHMAVRRLLGRGWWSSSQGLAPRPGGMPPPPAAAVLPPKGTRGLAQFHRRWLILPHTSCTHNSHAPTTQQLETAVEHLRQLDVFDAIEALIDTEPEVRGGVVGGGACCRVAAAVLLL